MAVTLQFEKVEDIRAEIDVLARAEYDEVETGIRPFGPDYEAVKWLERAGTFKCLTARRGDELVGYLIWFIDFDMESYGTLTANQGPWYVKPDQFGVAAKMFFWALREFRRLSVKVVYLHNTELGRGKNLGKFFERNGAVHISNTYALKITDRSSAED